MHQPTVDGLGEVDDPSAVDLHSSTAGAGQMMAMGGGGKETGYGDEYDVYKRTPLSPYRPDDQQLVFDPRPEDASTPRQSEPGAFLVTKSRITGETRAFLLEVFEKNPMPSTADRLELSALTGLDVGKIRTWFQNKRSYVRKQQNKAATEANYATTAASDVPLLVTSSMQKNSSPESKSRSQSGRKRTSAPVHDAADSASRHLPPNQFPSSIHENSSPESKSRSKSGQTRTSSSVHDAADSAYYHHLPPNQVPVFIDPFQGLPALSSSAHTDKLVQIDPNPMFTMLQTSSGFNPEWGNAAFPPGNRRYEWNFHPLLPLPEGFMPSNFHWGPSSTPMRIPVFVPNQQPQPLSVPVSLHSSFGGARYQPTNGDVEAGFVPAPIPMLGPGRVTSGGFSTRMPATFQYGDYQTHSASDPILPVNYSLDGVAQTATGGDGDTMNATDGSMGWPRC